jgi:hypothetical protein
LQITVKGKALSKDISHRVVELAIMDPSLMAATANRTKIECLCVFTERVPKKDFKATLEDKETAYQD